MLFHNAKSKASRTFSEDLMPSFANYGKSFFYTLHNAVVQANDSQILLS